MSTPLRPGESRAACATVTNSGDRSMRVGLYAPPARGELAPFLTLTVLRGQRPRDPSGSCAAFVADPGRAALFHGRLSDFPAGARDPIADPAVWAPGDAAAYRFELALGHHPAAEGLRAAWDWRFAAEPLPAGAGAAPAPAPWPGPRKIPAPTTPAPVQLARDHRPAPCAALALRGGAPIVKTFRYGRGRRAVVLVRLRSGRLRLSAGVATRRGRVLRDPRWSRVTWRLDGRRIKTARRAPFAAAVPATALRPGANVVVASVRPRRAQPRRYRFALGAQPAGQGCVLR